MCTTDRIDLAEVAPFFLFRYAGQVEMAVQDTLIEGRARDKGGEFVCKDGLTTRPATSWLEPQGVLPR